MGEWSDGKVRSDDGMEETDMKVQGMGRGCDGREVMRVTGEGMVWWREAQVW